MRKTVLIRVEGNAQIGMGHVNRCLAIADALAEKEVSVTFILSTDAAIQMIIAHNHECVVLNKTIGKDIEELQTLYHQTNANLLVIDSYDAGISYIASIRSTMPVFAFCEGSVFRGPVDIACDYNFSADPRWFEKTYAPLNALCLVGPRYVPLQKGYWNKTRINIKEEARDLLITSGGTDPLGICERIAKELASSNSDMRIHIAVGPFFKQAGSLESFAAENNAIVLHRNMPLSALLPLCDVVVSASGTTVYEVMRLGIPAVFYSFVDNQVKGQDALKPFNHIGDIRNSFGDIDERQLSEITKRVLKLFNSCSERRNISKQYIEFVDGQGAYRIACCITNWMKQKGESNDE